MTNGLAKGEFTFAALNQRTNLTAFLHFMRDTTLFLYKTPVIFPSYRILVRYYLSGYKTNVCFFPILAKYLY
uniref:Uncharacterized protein n=1 Tax=Mesocestoides corti TaxID=53468 RepID=A0A5K3FG68_MESCO